MATVRFLDTDRKRRAKIQNRAQQKNNNDVIELMRSKQGSPERREPPAIFATSFGTCRHFFFEEEESTG